MARMIRRRPQLGGPASLVLLAALASACTVIGHEKVQGWPALEIVEHYVPHAQMRDRCARYVSAFASPEACAEFHFAERQCHIWYSADFPPSRALIEHERLHCRGYDHIGANSMQAMLERWQAAEAPMAGAASAGATTER
jgi:hypothetical protein